MRVSDEMVERAADAMVMINNQASWVDLARAALTAALADVPEPEPGICVTLDERELWAMETDRADAAEARIAELEAKLADRDYRHGLILAELEEAEPMSDPDWRRTLRAILDGKEQP